VLYEVPFGYLAGQVVTVATCFFESTTPVLELDGKTAPLRVVDPTANSKARRPPKRPAPERSRAPIDFDPGRALDDEEDDVGDLF